MGMIREALGVFAVLAVLTAVGIGPALCCTGRRPRLSLALALAPALGLAIVGILSFPLLRWVGPLRMWALPLAGILATASAVLVLRAGKKLAPRSFGRLALPVAAWLGCVLVLVLPLVLHGVPYAVFRANAADAYIYISQAQATQDVSWDTLIRGASLADTAAAAKLGRESPGALMSARNLLVPITVNRNAAQAWCAQVAGTQAWRFYYPFHLVCFAAAAGVAMALAHLLGLGRGLASLAGWAVGAGFWARWVLESDAGYQIAATPLLMLAACAWVLAERRGEGLLTGERVLLAVAVAGMTAFYSPLLQVTLAAILCYLAVSVPLRQFDFRGLRGYALAGVVAVGLLFVTGQGDWHLRNLQVLAANSSSVFGAGQVVSAPLGIIETNGAAGFWGVPPVLLFGWLEQKLQLPLRFLCETWAVFLTLAAGMTAWLLLRRKSDPAQRVVLAFALAGVLTTVLLVVTDRSSADTANYAAGKALTFIFPFPLLLALGYTRWMGEQLTPPQQRGFTGLLGAFLAAQLLIGTYLPVKRSHPRPFSLAAETKLEEYDLTPILAHLRSNPPRKLAVWTPKEGHWIFEHYLMYALSEFRPYFQSGLVIDNNPLTPNLWPESLREAPDYAVVARDSDYVRERGLGTPVAETRDLVLYRLSGAEPGLMNQIARDLERTEQSHPKKVLLIGQPGWKP